jgi:DNA sulfur modification protein DndB
MSSIINYKTYPDLNQAQLEAQKEVADSGAARSFPITIFKQGTREFISTVFPVFYIISDLKSKPTEKDKGLYDVRTSMNRPIDSNHAKNTKEYIKRNFKEKYIIPSMTLNVQEPINIYTADYKSSVRQGYMVIPYGIKLAITDGQHRKRALEELCRELSPAEFDVIKNDGISVMITVENDINQIHQDFADCSKTKELPKSLIAVYDKRNPANGLVIDLIDTCPLFKEKVDATSNTLSKKSTKLLLVSQVRSAIKELLFASSATGDVELETRTLEMYGSSDSTSYKKDVKKFIDFINRITEKIPILKTIAEMHDSIQMTKLPGLRADYLILNSAGINILCRAGHYIVRDDEKYNEMDKYVDRLAKIDWKKSAEIWNGNIVQLGAKGLKISTSNSTLKAAFNKVKEAIELENENIANDRIQQTLELV